MVIADSYPSIVIHVSGEMSSSVEQSDIGSDMFGATSSLVHRRGDTITFSTHRPVPTIYFHLHQRKRIWLAMTMLTRSKTSKVQKRRLNMTFLERLNGTAGGSQVEYRASTPINWDPVG
jgi:hypothetical protein